MSEAGSGQYRNDSGEFTPANRRRRRTVQPFEWMTMAHVAILFVAASWAFGGQADAVRGPLTAWASIGVVITLAALLRKETRERAGRALWWTIPWLLFNGLVLWASMAPSFREIRDGADTLLVRAFIPPWRPSSARPELARQALWQFDVVWISCFNLALIVRRRRVLRTLILIVTANALVLAIFGTVQKLSHSPGLFFGSVPSPQKYFFASFVYHNHWGAFMLLAIAATLALANHYVRRKESRDWLHSPAMMGLVAVLILAATIPLSASRSSTVLACLLLGGAFLGWIGRLIKKRRYFNESIALPVALAIGGIVVGTAAVVYLGRDTIAMRTRLTLQQVEVARTTATPDARALLYHDTWRMAQAKPVFGWGMASYPYVFMLYNTRESPIDRLPVFYHDAHSDWLQAIAEHGFVGTALLVALVLAPILSVGRRLLTSLFALHLLAGCAAIVLYATLEFPFGNYAVVLTWWLCFFTALQYSRLQDATSAAEPQVG